MATITIQVVASGNTVGRTKTISGPHLVRFIAAYKAILGQVDNGSGGFRDMTDDETVLAWADGLLAGTKQNILSHEKVAAAATASAAVTDITLS